MAIAAACNFPMKRIDDRLNVRQKRFVILPGHQLVSQTLFLIVILFEREDFLTQDPQIIVPTCSEEKSD